MTHARLDLHGLVLDLDDRLAGGPARALLAALPAAAPDAAAALRIRLARAREPRPLPPGRAAFFHGAVRAVERDGAIALGDGASVLTVSADGHEVEGEIHASSHADPHAFSQAFLLVALLVALRHHGVYHLHAAALRAPSGAGLLVAGSAGSGKSTVALALAAAGHAFLGDDAILLSRRGGRPELRSLPRAFHVAGATARAFPALAPLLGAEYAGTGKRLLDAERAFGRPALAALGPPAAILFPSVAERAETDLAPLPPADALGRLIEASALVAAHGMAGPEAQLALLRDLADAARALRVELGRDLLTDPAAWAERIARAACP